MNKQILNIGVDIGGTYTKFGIINSDGKVIHHKKLRTQLNPEPNLFIEVIIENIKTLADEANISIDIINSIGIGVPGTVDSSKGVVVFAPNLFWRNVEIIKIIKRKINNEIFIAQDSRAAAWAEYLIGCAKNYQSIVSITLGTGVGCGIVNEGKILHGGLNTAGEFGHQLVKLNGKKCNCGKRGCIEAYIGGRSILDQSFQNKSLKRCLFEKFGSSPTVKNIYSLAESGNIEALKITNSVWLYLGIGLVNLINLLSPQLISISGGISNAKDNLLFDPLTEFVKNNVYSPVSDKIEIVKSRLNDIAPLIGASMLYSQKDI